MRHGDVAGFRWVFENVMGAANKVQPPAGGFELLDEFGALHRCVLYTLFAGRQARWLPECCPGDIGGASRGCHSSGVEHFIGNEEVQGSIPCDSTSRPHAPLVFGRKNPDDPGGAERNFVGDFHS